MTQDTMKIKIGGSKIKDNISYLENWRKGNNPGPLVVEIGPVYGCNHSCEHCGFQKYSLSYTGYKFYNFFTDSDILKKFLDEFKYLGGIEVYFAGYGEPLLNPLLTEWIQYGHKIGLSIALSTNGVLLNDKKISDILPFLSWIKFSINGGNKTIYTKVHRCKNYDFEKLLHNLEQVVNYRNSNKLNTKLVIQFLTYNLNWQSIPDILNIHKNIGTDLLTFRNVVLKDKNLFYFKNIIDFLKEIDGEKIDIRWDSFQEIGKNLNWKKCYGINFRTNLDHRGNLFTCCRHFLTNSIYGNIHKDSFVKIWNSEHKKKIFAEVEQGYEKNGCMKWCGSLFDNIFIENYLKES